MTGRPTNLRDLPLELWVSEITYKPGWTFDLIRHFPYDDRDLAIVRITAKVPDVRDPTVSAEIGQVAYIYDYIVDRPDPKDAFMEWVFSAVLQLEKHEVNEWFRVRGAPLHEPHPATTQTV